MSNETRPPREHFHWDSPEYYRWYEHGGNPRQNPLNQDELTAYLQKEKGYSSPDAKHAAKATTAKPKEKEENTVEVVRQQDREKPDKVKAESAAKPDKSAKKKSTANQDTEAQQVETQEAFPESYRKDLDLPASVQKHFLRVGEKFYYEKNPDQLAFKDKGHKLLTKSSGAMVAASLIQIAKSRGWTEIKVRGSDDFRRNIWLKGNVQGLEVKGYEPKGADLATLARQLQQVDQTELKAKEATPEKTAEHEAIQTSADGQNQKRSIKAKAVQETRPEQLVKNHPDLANEAATVKLAEKIAHRFPNKADQQRFVGQVKTRVAAKVEQGHTFPQIKIREVRLNQKAQVTQIQKR